MTKLWTVPVCILCMLTCSFSQTSQESLDTEINKLYETSDIPGFAVAIVNSDNILFKKAYGLEDINRQRPFTAQQRFNIASTSKTFIGIALMSLVEDGRLTLDTPINDVLPYKVDNPHNKVQITIEHLATHTASILDNDNERKSFFLEDEQKLSKKIIGKDAYKTFCSWSNNSKMKLGDFLKASLTKDGAFYSKKRFAKTIPGDTYAYSNIGAALAAYIIEIKTGKPYDQFMEQFVAREFGFPSGIWKHHAEILPTSYFQNKVEIPLYQPILYPAGGMMLSCEELAQYLISMIKGYKGESNILQQTSFQKMMNSTEGNGIFWELKGTKIGHNGGNYGVICLMNFDRDTGIGKILLTNISSYKSNKLLNQVIEIWNVLDKFNGLEH